MKLISLKLSNLNSLKGDWSINFEAPIFTQNGIFAIVGDTGAGKTTILDAICLAIYGQTPRLDKITASHNDIMNIQSGDCSAEVELESQGKRYLFVFQQKRARNSPQGKLQDPKREISEFDQQGQPKLLANKISQVEQLSVEILGMDFNQFKRSVMLAQGKFGEFLNAKPEERGELLEKITGTHIYSQLGKLAYETLKTKKHALALKYNRLDDMLVLSDEAFAQLQNDVHLAQQKKDTLQSDHAHLIKQTALLSNLIALSQKEQTYKDKLAHAKQALDDFEPDNTRLILAHKAKNLHGDHVSLTALSDSHSDSTLRLTKLKQTLPTLESKLKDTEHQVNIAQGNLHTAKINLDNAKPIIHSVQSLEKQLTAINSQLNHAKQELDILNQNLDKKTTLKKDTLTKQTTLQSQLSHHQTAIEQTRHLMDINGDIHTTLTDWHNNLDKLFYYFITLQTHQKDVEHLRNDEKQAHHQLTQAQLSHTNTEQQKTTQELKLANLCQLTHFDTLALEKHLSWLNTKKEQLTNNHKELNQLCHTLKQNDAHATLTHNHHQQHILCQEIAIITDKLTHLNDDLHHAKQLLDKTQQKHTLLLQIHALEDHLNKLQEGDPCPLCGSSTHPKKALVPTHNELSQSHQALEQNQHALNAQQQLIDEHTALLHTKERALNELIAQAQTLKTHHQTMISNYQQTYHACQNTLIEHQIALDDDLSTAIITAFEHAKEHSDTTVLVETLDKFKEFLATIIQQHSTQLETFVHQYQNYELICQTLANDGHALALATQTHTHAQNTLTSERNKAKETINALLATLNILHSHGELLANTLEKILHPFDLPTLTSWQTIHQTICTLKDIGVINQHTLLDFYQAYNTLINHNTPPIYTKLVNAIKALVLSQQSHQEEQHAYAKTALLLENTISTLNELDSDIGTLNTQKHACQSEIDRLNTEQDIINTKCKQAIGNQSLQDFEEKLIKYLNHAQLDFDTTKDAHTTAKHEFDSHQRLIAEEKQRLTELNLKLSQKQQAFADLLSKQGFENIETYQNALLDETALTELSTKKDTLTHDYAVIDKTLNTLKDEQSALTYAYQHEFGTLKEDKITLLNQLEQQKTALSHDIEVLLGTLGANTQQYHQAQANLAQRQALQDDINREEKNLSVWQHLNELIGCSTGKTYRNYVQSLSLDILLAHANHALHKITDRYTLAQSSDTQKDSKSTALPKATLGIEVIDHYQADQRRSSKNLSGGESFLVSLGLALGLSSINSQKIHIGSLFLDEGFGTLDEDALDVALTALSEIEQTGKTIGIISHVLMLKERISTQILVQKHSGGRSSLHGAGINNKGR